MRHPSAKDFFRYTVNSRLYGVVLLGLVITSIFSGGWDGFTSKSRINLQTALFSVFCADIVLRLIVFRWGYLFGPLCAIDSASCVIFFINSYGPTRWVFPLDIFTKLMLGLHIPRYCQAVVRVIGLVNWRGEPHFVVHQWFIFTHVAIYLLSMVDMIGLDRRKLDDRWKVQLTLESVLVLIVVSIYLMLSEVQWKCAQRLNRLIDTLVQQTGGVSVPLCGGIYRVLTAWFDVVSKVVEILQVQKGIAEGYRRALNALLRFDYQSSEREVLTDPIHEECLKNIIQTFKSLQLRRESRDAGNVERTIALPADDGRIGVPISQGFIFDRREITCMTIRLLDHKDLLHSDPRSDEGIHSIITETLCAIEWSKGVVLSVASGTIVAAWNANEREAEHHLTAAKCALKLKSQYVEWKKRLPWKEQMPVIGIASGHCMIGRCGPPGSCFNEVIGRCVEESRTLTYMRLDVPILITGEMYLAVNGSFNAWPCEVANMGGRKICVYSLFSKHTQPPHGAPLQDYTLAFSKYESCQYISAMDSFRGILLRGKSADLLSKEHREIIRLSCKLFAESHRALEGYGGNKHFGWIQGAAQRLDDVDIFLKERVDLDASWYNVSPSVTSFSIIPFSETNHENHLTMIRKELAQNALDPLRTGPCCEATSQIGFGTLCLSDLPHVRVFQDLTGKKWNVSRHLLGRGGFGSVFMGMSESGCAVAIKDQQVIPTSENEGKMVRELTQEIEVLSKLRHNHIIQYLGCAVNSAQFPPSLLIVMELAPCGSLKDVVDRFGALPYGSVKRFTSQIVEGLLYLHNHGIIHRDIKPGNVLLDQNGTCKLADFGAARFETSKTDVKGTAAYMAPESFHSGQGKETDIWSLGITVLELILGRSPWRHLDLESGCALQQQLIYQIVVENATPEIPDTLNPNAAMFIASCVQRDPSQRPTCETLRVHPFLL